MNFSFSFSRSYQFGPE